GSALSVLPVVGLGAGARTERVAVALMRLPRPVADPDRHHRILLRVGVVADRDLVLRGAGALGLREAGAAEDRERDEQADRAGGGRDDAKAAGSPGTVWIAHVEITSCTGGHLPYY